MCLYFFEQLGSGHSSSTGDAGGLPLLTGDAGTVEGSRDFLPAGVGGSSSPDRFLRLLLGSGLGGTKAVGDAVPVAVLLALLPLLPALPPPRRPLAPPLRSLLCTDDLVSVKLLRSLPGVVAAAALPRLPLPFGVLASRSLVGESQNLRRKT